MDENDTEKSAKLVIDHVCREGLFLLPYNELAVAQGPKIYQKKAL